ncbi:ATP-binding protein [Azospirillum sp. sgz302134]
MPHYFRLFLLLVVAVIPLAALQFTTQYNLRRDREVEVQNEAVRLLALIDAEQKGVVADAQHVLAAVVETGVAQAAPSGCQAALDRLKSHFPGYLTVELADRQGTVWCTTQPQSMGLSIAGVATFRQALDTGGFVLGEYGRDFVTGRPVLPFRLAYKGADGQPAGIATVLLDVGWIEQELSRRPMPPGASILIADRNGTIMARAPERPEVIGRPLPDQILERMRNAQGVETFEAVGVDGVNRVIAMLPLETGTRGTMLAVGIDPTSAMRPVQAAMVRSLAVFGGVLLLCCLGAAWGMRQFLRVRERMHETALEMAAVLESTNDAVAEVDRDWRVVFVNERAKALLPAAATIHGKNGWAALPYLVGSEMWRCLHKAMEERVPVEFEILGPTTGIWFSVRAFPSRKGLAIYFQDVGQRKRHEEERAHLTRQLESERSLLQAVLDHMPSGLLVAEAPSGRIVKTNATAELLLGAPIPTHLVSDAAECASAVFGAFRPDGTPYGPDECPFARALRRGEMIEQEDMAYRRADGSMAMLSASTAPVRDADGRVTLTIVTLRDVGERRAMELALHQAKEEADHANRAKSKFLAAASHDLRQPMQSMFLFTGILHRHIQDEQGQRSLEMLERGLDTLKGLLDSLLDVSRLDAGAIEPRIESFPLTGLIDEIVASYAPILESKKLAFRIVQDRAVSVRSDRVLLGRMLRNLVENAVKYTERGAVQIGYRLLDGTVRIEVSDTGIGIPPDQLTQIFAEFHQVDNPERDRARGLGLGLAIVQRLSSILDHPVEVRSQPGRGSVFSIEVPVDGAEADAEPVRSVADDRVESGGKRLALLVDDDAIVLLGLRDMFREWGYEVMIAGSADQAVERVEAAGRFPDVMLVDYRLREGSVGTEAVLRVREMAGADIPALILTGESGPECEQDARQHGLKVVRKPVTPRQLRRALDRALEGGMAEDLQSSL